MDKLRVQGESIPALEEMKELDHFKTKSLNLKEKISYYKQDQQKTKQNPSKVAGNGLLEQTANYVVSDDALENTTNYGGNNDQITNYT